MKIFLHTLGFLLGLATVLATTGVCIAVIIAAAYHTIRLLGVGQ